MQPIFALRYIFENAKDPLNPKMQFDPFEE
ncbi:hypothetical protein NTGM5_560076 [Candidatus Nitrotoga sp. M5]|nr:hypothetical protein NTGM5_560076 [Candidatus Nitrotoga sp. M5]